MKESVFKSPSILFSILGFVAFFVYSFHAMSQTPQNVPKPDDAEPLALDDPTNIIFFIILPLLFVILFIWLWKKKQRENRK